jgi:hypothetical protein
MVVLNMLPAYRMRNKPPQLRAFIYIVRNWRVPVYAATYVMCGV